MDKHMLSICDECNIGIFRDQLKSLLQTVFDLNQFFSINRGIDQEEEHRWILLSSQDILYSSVIFDKFTWEIGLTDETGVMLGEVVLCCTEWAYPKFESEIHMTRGVEH